MKTLYVIRHAKSSWDELDLSDFERPLNERGKRDAPRIGVRLKMKGVLPGTIVSSPAKRAFSTAKRIAKVIGFPKDKIKTDRELYHAAEETILSVLRTIKNKHNVAFVVGHNPGLTDFVNTLRNDDLKIENIPTCGIVMFEIGIESWEQLQWGIARQAWFDYPKSKDD
jgi:phosphohistidine phosphatase